MSAPKIERSVAEAHVKEWADRLGFDLQELPGDVVRAEMDGRIIFDESAETFLIRLRKPIERENGKQIEELLISEPTAKQIADSSKGTSDQMAITIRLLSAMSGQPVSIIDRLRLRDLMLSAGILSFFALPAEKPSSG